MWTAFQWISKYWKACTETSPSSALGGVLGVLGERVYGGREETEFITSTVRFPWHWPLCLIDSGSSGTWLFRVSLQFLFTIMAWKLSLYPVNVKFFPWDHRYLRFTGTTEGETTAWDISSVFRNYFLVLFCLFVCLTQILVLVYAWVCVWGGAFAFMLHSWNAMCDPCFRKPFLPGMVAHTFNPSTPEAEAGVCLWVQELHNEFQDS